MNARKHDLNLIGALLTVKDATVWSSKKSTSLLKQGAPYPAVNAHGVRIGWIAFDNWRFFTKNGIIIECPEKYKKYLK